jgi:hypothetical protein
MDWSKGFSAAYIMQTVDPATWRDTNVIQITGGTIKRELTGKRESADVDCKGIEIGVERWVRIYLETQQDGASARTALFTGLATSPADEYEGNARSNTLSCYSVLKPCEDVALPLGWYAPQNANGAEVIRQLLSVTPAPVLVEADAPTLSDHIIAESNENHLTMIDKILTAIDWRIQIDGDGTIHVEPKPIDLVASFDPLENDMIETKVKVSADLYACPNVYRATSGDVTGIARDEDPDSPLSIQNRGREVWKSESGVNLASTESIAQYARRMLKQAQQVRKSASYTRRYMPNVRPSDLIRMGYPAQGLTGVYMVQSQTVALEYGAATDEQIMEA